MTLLNHNFDNTQCQVLPFIRFFMSLGDKFFNFIFLENKKDRHKAGLF